MQISRERMKLVSREADNVIGSSFSINDNYMITALLRAVVLSRTEWTPESASKACCCVSYRVGSDRDMRAVLEVHDYALIISETKNGYFPSEYAKEGWKALDEAPYPINRYLSQFVKTRIFVNDEHKRVVAVIDRRVTNKWIQGFLSTFPRILTWYFTSELTEEEQAFFKAISVANKNVTEEEAERIFVDYVNKVADAVDFRRASLHKYLDGYAKTVTETQISSYRQTVTDTMTSISRYQSDLAGLYRRLDESQRVLKALIDSPDESSEELFNFFDSHKCLDLMNVFGDTIRFGITETLDFYDEEEFLAIFNRQDSYMRREASSSDVLRVMEAVFSKHIGSFVTNAVFELTSMRYISMKQDLSRSDVLPHPHIYFFQCSGGNDQYYSKYAESGDWQLAIEQAIGATKNLNFGDSTVVSKMIRWIGNNKNVQCIKLADSGRVVSVNELIKILNEGERQNG